jgi:predicted ABC-type ATPase
MNRPRMRMFAGPNGSGKSTIKIVSRYIRSLDLLLPAIRRSNRAYLFDNSRHAGEQLWIAEITEGRNLETKCSPLPLWFQRAVWEKIVPAS